MRKSLSLRLFSSLAALAPLVSSQTDCWSEDRVIFSKEYKTIGTSLQNCTAEIDTELCLSSSHYSGKNLGALIQSVTNESLQSNGYNSGNELVGSVVQKNFDFGCMNVDSYPVAFCLSIKLFATSGELMAGCLREYRNSSLPQLQDLLAAKLSRAARPENAENIYDMLYALLALLALIALMLLSFTGMHFCSKPKKKEPLLVSGSGSYGTFSEVELQNLAEQDNGSGSECLGTDDGVYELPPNAV